MCICWLIVEAVLLTPSEATSSAWISHDHMAGECNEEERAGKDV